MTEENKAPDPDEVQAELRRWIEGQFQNMGRHAVENGLIEGEKAEGRPAWAMPGKLFIGKIWDSADESNAWWIISGAVPADHLQASVAETPREALRHFCLKWQMQNARLDKAAESDHPADQQAWTGIGENLAAQAEALYSLVDDDKLWESA